MDELPREINIITLNCWGLKYISKLRNERLTEIGRRIASSVPTPHVVALQECWTQEDYKSIRRETRFILPYGKFYHSGAFGGGLAILSRWPIEESTMFRYPLNGRPTAFFRGDWYVGKGVACAKIRYGPAQKQVIEVFNTHTHAPYEKEPNDSYICHRTAQAWEISKLIRGAIERGHLVLGVGDFNFRPLSLAHRIITAHGGAHDTWRVLHPDSSLGAADDAAEKTRRRPIPMADFNVRENGVTSDSVYNTWRWTPKQRKLLGEGKPCVVPNDCIDRRAKRLDYIFVGDGSDPGTGWAVKKAQVGMVERHPKLGCSLSDHFSVEATLSYHVAPKPRQNDDGVISNGTYLQSPTGSEHRNSKGYDKQLKPLSAADHGLSSATYDEILLMIHKYVQREKQQQWWRAAHFYFWVIILVGCLVAVWFSPHNYVAFILVLMSSLGLTAGTVDGLMALLFFSSELRALKEFEWEILNAKAAASGGGAVEEESEREKSW